MKKVLALIPARGGSKGIKQKNIRDFCKRPLIAWTIGEAKKSRYIDRLVVSTDSREIAEISRGCGAEVPFLRPRELSGDNTPTVESVLHAVQWLAEHEGYSPDYVLLLQCTSPNRLVRHVDEAIMKLLQDEADADSLISVCSAQHHPFWMQKMNEKGFLEDFIEHDRAKYARRQDLPPVYRLNGAIYMIKTQVLLAYHDFQTQRTIPYVMDELHSMDIDTEQDFIMAEYAREVFKERFE